MAGPHVPTKVLVFVIYFTLVVFGGKWLFLEKQKTGTVCMCEEKKKHDSTP
jgi:hypothetical protein